MTTTTIKPEELELSTSRDIFVTTLDDKQISFKGGEYAVIATDSQRVIRGNGSFNSKETKPSSFKGDLPFNVIATILTREKTAFYYAGPILVIAFVGTYFLLHGNLKQ